jgi:hypothetical protein
MLVETSLRAASNIFDAVYTDKYTTIPKMKVLDYNVFKRIIQLLLPGNGFRNDKRNMYEMFSSNEVAAFIRSPSSCPPNSNKDKR